MIWWGMLSTSWEIWDVVEDRLEEPSFSRPKEHPEASSSLGDADDGDRFFAWPFLWRETPGSLIKIHSFPFAEHLEHGCSKLHLTLDSTQAWEKPSSGYISRYRRKRTYLTRFSPWFIDVSTRHRVWGSVLSVFGENTYVSPQVLLCLVNKSLRVNSALHFYQIKLSVSITGMTLHEDPYRASMSTFIVIWNAKLSSLTVEC
jgi:hypothetical protein